MRRTLSIRPVEGRLSVVTGGGNEWPALPTTGFVSGRAATKRDVQDGNAVFVAERDGKGVGIALRIDIPQYAVHVDQESGARTRVILIQAERAESIDIVGYMTFEGTHGAGMLTEFELLGTALPKVP